MKHPDREAQERLSLLFELFLARKSAAQVVRGLREPNLGLPRRDCFRLQWARRVAGGDVPRAKGRRGNGRQRAS